jgi:hypothetical protein
MEEGLGRDAAVIEADASGVHASIDQRDIET